MEALATPPVKENQLLNVFTFLFYPTGVYRIWKKENALWLRLLYTLLGLPLFLIIATFLAIIAFASFLPDLDMSIGDRKDRTVINREGNYASTFLKTGRETNGAYELIRVEVEPNGGNSWHYHKTFDEQFTVEQGELTVGLEGREIKLQAGQEAQAKKSQLHFFQNKTATKAVLIVKTTPARGLEKSVRIVYGLGNDGQFKGEITQNPWHMALLLGYSETFLPDIPPIIQEPMVKSLAKIAQWKGEDKALERYFR
ncbi:MAG TPA: cupin domain-containing protein [Fibrella sp.]